MHEGFWVATLERNSSLTACTWGTLSSLPPSLPPSPPDRDEFESPPSSPPRQPALQDGGGHHLNVGGMAAHAAELAAPGEPLQAQAQAQAHAHVQAQAHAQGQAQELQQDQEQARAHDETPADGLAGAREQAWARVQARAQEEASAFAQVRARVQAEAEAQARAQAQVQAQDEVEILELAIRFATEVERRLHGIYSGARVRDHTPMKGPVGSEKRNLRCVFLSGDYKITEKDIPRSRFINLRSRNLRSRSKSQPK